mmetsp:Transcript_74343/g.191804  ORF Transcript_74343/g.191804 Transcript_74343/m.191804 type:complete len:205 (+) Transcript_74343:1021-1635(+)
MRHQRAHVVLQQPLHGGRHPALAAHAGVDGDGHGQRLRLRAQLEGGGSVGPPQAAARRIAAPDPGHADDERGVVVAAKLDRPRGCLRLYHVRGLVQRGSRRHHVVVPLRDLPHGDPRISPQHLRRDQLARLLHRGLRSEVPQPEELLPTVRRDQFRRPRRRLPLGRRDEGHLHGRQPADPEERALRLHAPDAELAEGGGGPGGV